MLFAQSDRYAFHPEIVDPGRGSQGWSLGGGGLGGAHYVPVELIQIRLQYFLARCTINTYVSAYHFQPCPIDTAIHMNKMSYNFPL